MQRESFINYLYNLDDYNSLSVVRDDYTDKLYSGDVFSDEILVECKSCMTAIFFKLKLDMLNDNDKISDEIIDKYKYLKSIYDCSQMFSIFGYAGTNFFDWLDCYYNNMDKINSLLCKLAFKTGVEMYYKVIDENKSILNLDFGFSEEDISNALKLTGNHINLSIRYLIIKKVEEKI